MQSADLVVCRTLTRRCVGARLIHDFEARGRAGIAWRELADSTLTWKCCLLRASRHEELRLKRLSPNPMNVSASSAVRKRLRRAWLSSALRPWLQTNRCRPAAHRQSQPFHALIDRNHAIKAPVLTAQYLPPSSLHQP